MYCVNKVSFFFKFINIKIKNINIDFILYFFIIIRYKIAKNYLLMIHKKSYLKFNYII